MIYQIISKVTAMEKLTKSALALYILLAAGFASADDDFFDKNEGKKSGFEKKLYYGLEKTDGLTPQQKESINQILKQFQAQKERQIAKNVKKFQSDDIKKESMMILVTESNGVDINAKTSLLSGIHKVLTPKQREQFIKKFQGMID